MPPKPTTHLKRTLGPRRQTSDDDFVVSDEEVEHTSPIHDDDEMAVDMAALSTSTARPRRVAQRKAQEKLQQITQAEAQAEEEDEDEERGVVKPPRLVKLAVVPKKGKTKEDEEEYHATSSPSSSEESSEED